MTVQNLNVAVILELAAATLMTLRMKDLSNKNDDFYPLNDPNWLEESEMIEVESSADMTTQVDENDINTAIERITKSIMFEFVDDGLPKSRNGNFDGNYEDDEGLARKIMNHYYQNIARGEKKDHRTFYAAIGKLFSENLKFMKRNCLYYKVFLMSRSQAEEFTDEMSNTEKEAIIRREVDPNHRNSFVTIIGYEESRADGRIIEKLRDNILRKQAIANKNYFKVV